MTKVNDYFFGSYTTPQRQRLRAVVRNGIEHASVISPVDPQPGHAVALTILSEARLPIDRVACAREGADSTPCFGHLETQTGSDHEDDIR
ncbi:MAG TPA: hypothetical protein VF725_07515 [Ktedonobacterales bacterium]